MIKLMRIVVKYNLECQLDEEVHGRNGQMGGKKEG